MAHFHFDDDEYWQNCPPELEAFRVGNKGIRNAHFVMGTRPPKNVEATPDLRVHEAVHATGGTR